MTTKLFDVKKEYEGDPKLDKNKVMELIKWSEDQPHLPNITEHESVLFLTSCQYDEELTKKTIDSFFTLRTNYSDIFAAIDPLSAEIQENFRMMCVAGIPELTPEGYRVFYTHLNDKDIGKFSTAHHYANFDMVVLLFNYLFGPSKGTIMVIDSEGASFTFFTRMTMGFSATSHYVHYLQDAVPVKIQGIYMVNNIPLTGKFLKILKPMTKSELFHKIKVLDKHEEMEELLPKQFICKDFGGDAPSIKQIDGKTKELLIQNRDFFINEIGKKVDETKRVKIKKSSSWKMW